MPPPPQHSGHEGIIAGQTAISTLQDGLLYRGYPIEELADHGTYEEVAYLILHGELPASEQLATFTDRLRRQAILPAEIIDVLRRIPSPANLMDIMRSGASLLAHWDPDQSDNARDANLRKSERLIATLPVLMAARYRLAHGQDPIPPDRNYSHAENLLRMLGRSVPGPSSVRALQTSLIVYAELEFNTSTFTARVVASTDSDIYSAITAAIGALKGPLHGGANQRVLEVLQQVGAADNAEAWVRNALVNKVRITGFGHRVYKDGDPRAMLLKPLCQKLAAETGNVEMETMADTIERIVGQEKRLFPNVDWPTARLYHYLGLPVELYTPLFAVARMAGWCAHFIEQLDQSHLMSFAAKYIGPARRSWVPLENR